MSGLVSKDAPDLKCEICGKITPSKIYKTGGKYRRKTCSRECYLTLNSSRQLVVTLAGKKVNLVKQLQDLRREFDDLKLHLGV